MAISRFQKLSNNLSQLPLPFQISDDYREEVFLLLPENSSAFGYLEKFFSQKNFASAQFSSLILKGEKACGKTHLLNIFAHKSNAQFLDITKNPSEIFCENKFYILEDIEKITDEEWLLRMINFAAEAKSFLIFSVGENPKFRLKDLNSRLKNIFIAEIKNPDFESIKQLLANFLSRRQINLVAKDINFIAKNIDRTYEAILSAVKKYEMQ